MAQCEGGLHGLPWGEGDGELLNWDADAVWQVVAVDVAAGVVDLSGKIKFCAGQVVHTGDRLSATQYIISHGADPANRSRPPLLGFTQG